MRRRALYLVVLAWALSAAVASGRTSHVASHLADTDGDGLPDVWEREGVTIDTGAGPQFIDLPAMGADPNRPDIFLQIDWMAGAEHDQHPAAEAIALVVEAFASSPYVSPAGTIGIALHVDAGPGSVLRPGATWGPLSRARALPWQKNLGSTATGSYDWAAFDAIKQEPGGFLDTGRGPIFHYAIFGAFHDLDDPHGWGASGNSRGIGGTDLIVTLANFTDGVGTAREQAGTLMHELGHNLGLRHGGCDDTNLKPGYASVMNYAYQMEGVTRGGMRGVLDYARGPEPVLDDVVATGFDALLGSPTPAGDGTRACVAPGAVRAGLAVRHALSPDATTRGAERSEAGRCADGEAIDDWRTIRLDLGGIGRLPARR